MGIAFAIFYFPALGILSLIAVFLSVFLGKWDKSPAKFYANLVPLGIGAVSSVLLTILGVYLFSKVDFSNDYAANLIYLPLFTLLFPITLGFIMILFAHILQSKEGIEQKVITINKIGAGMFNGVWLLPVTGILYLIVPWFLEQIALVFTHYFNAFFDLFV